jgi:ArsR family transcriptional regulator, arsenate/arsenite/antimonite-responsive transcriptional repressor
VVIAPTLVDGAAQEQPEATRIAVRIDEVRYMVHPLIDVDRHEEALADPRRVRIVNLLATSPDPVCVCELTGPLGLRQPTVSHHLKKLVEAGLLEREQRGIWAYYGLNRDALARLAAAVDLKGADR